MGSGKTSKKCDPTLSARRGEQKRVGNPLSAGDLAKAKRKPGAPAGLHFR